MVLSESIEVRDTADGRLLVFPDNRLASLLFGPHDAHLAELERWIDVRIVNRGNRLLLQGGREAVEAAARALSALYARLERGEGLEFGDVAGVARLALAAGGTGTDAGEAPPEGDLRIVTRKRVIKPRSPNQARYIAAMRHHDLTFGVGPAGTGKTYLAVMSAVEAWLHGEVSRIVLSRPAVEAGERLGFLPGDLREKVDPYLRPLYDALYDALPAEQVEKRIASGEIEIAPLAYMRGRTLADAWVILDEAQNTTPAQMKMFLTRFGEGAKVVVCGDPTQIDLPDPGESGLIEALELLKDIPEVATVWFDESDVVRHPLVQRILAAYRHRDARRREKRR
ncbi:MAG: phosphate starvation protein PhoH [Rhodothalassiaceae bacterium]|nr:MAG: phosphate starvation protein PhoH [Rhodothalassiaceae bacterium]